MSLSSSLSHVLTISASTDEIEVAGHGTAYLKLWFSGVRAEQGVSDVYLFLNDDTGHSEDCFLFQIQTTER